MLDFLIDFIKGLIIGSIVVLCLVLAKEAVAGVRMEINFYDRKQVIRQFEDLEEVLMFFQSKDACAAGVQAILIERTIIEGLDDE